MQCRLHSISLPIKNNSEKGILSDIHKLLRKGLYHRVGVVQPVSVFLGKSGVKPSVAAPQPSLYLLYNRVFVLPRYYLDGGRIKKKLFPS